MSEIILEIGAEGGSITLSRSRSSNEVWLFSLRAFDCSDDEPQQEADQDSSRVSKLSAAYSWPEAVGLLNRYASWYRLYPLALHPEFEHYILDEVKKHGGKAEVDRWRRILFEEGHQND
jgi:hypothetical protein